MKKLFFMMAVLCAILHINGQVIFSKKSQWKYLNIDSAPPVDWKQKDFADSSWPSGLGEFGFGEGDEATVLIKKNPSVTYYFRKSVTFSSDPSSQLFEFNFKHDDAAIVYVNGIEVIRTAQMPAGEVFFNTGTSTFISNDLENVYQSYTIAGSSFQIGDNTIAVEVHNQNTSSSDISFDAELVVASSIFPKKSEWKYLNIDTAPPTNWSTEHFDDTTWSSGKGEFGFGDGDETTLLVKKNPSLAYYFRKKIYLGFDPKNSLYKINMKHDDGAVIYINGVEVKRTDLMPTGVITYTTGTTSAISGENDYYSYVIAGSTFKKGENTIAIEVHNQSTSSSDVSFDAELLESELENDGPYVLYRNGKTVVHQIIDNKVVTQTINSTTDASKITVAVGDGRSFEVTLRRQFEKEPSRSVLPQKMLVFSDIEGNMPALVSVLQKAGVMNEQFEWSYGKGEVVYAGDMFDRGTQVIECLWLIYKLEAEAAAAGGKIHFIMGNHDVMNLTNDLRYVAPKYFVTADVLQENITNIHDQNSELGRWLRSKNVIEKIGPYIFLHGGVSPEIADLGLTYEQMNNYAHQKIANASCTGDCSQINSGSGLYWYRGIAQNTLTQEQVDNMLIKMDGTKTFMGHTILADTITTLYDKKAYLVDIHHESTYANNKTVVALLYENCNFYQLKTSNLPNELTLLEIVTNNITLPVINTSMDMSIAGAGTYQLGSCQNTFGEITTTGNISDITGDLSLKEWVEPSQSSDFVRRHYEITPQNNMANATGHLKLYFSQQDFDQFNMLSSVKLPSSGSDAGGISNLKISKIIGRSNDGSGLPASYSAQETVIDPSDSNIVWDPIQQLWSVNIPVTGFGAFYIKANAPTLSNDSQNSVNDKVILYPTVIEKNGQINIDLPYEKSHFYLYSTEGKIVGQHQLKRGNNSFNLTIKTSGIYLYTISDEKGHIIRGKIIVK